MRQTKPQYTCSMHPEVVSDQPCSCPKCGMTLILKENETPADDDSEHHAGHHPKQAIDHSAHNKHAGHSLKMFWNRFWICLLLTVPVVLYSDITPHLFKWSPPAFPVSTYLPLLFGSIVFFYGGWIFVKGAWGELRARQPGMMALISLAIVTAYLYSVYATLAGQEGALYWELTTLITVMLLGHWLEMRAVQSTEKALSELSKLLPDKAEVVRAGKTQEITLAELRIGDIMIILPGGRIPADGLVVEGKSEVDESLVTGESKPVSKTIKNEVIGGTVNGDGALQVKVNKIGEQTFLAGVMRLVTEAQASKSKLQLLSDRAASYLTIIALSAGAITVVAWIASGATVSFAVERLVAVLVIACPHALGLAVPLVATISTTLAARNGFLVRRRLALETARNINVVLFDKTGTLTKGEYGVVGLVAKNKNEEDRVLQWAASVDNQSEHFVAKAIVKEATTRGLSLLPIKSFTRVPGKGVSGIIDGQEILVGGESIFTGKKQIVSKEISKLSQEGKTIIYVLADGEFIGAIALADLIRDESRVAIKDLQQMGIKVAMLTGDSEDVARWVAGELHMDEYFAKVLPDQKSANVKKLQAKGLKVAMVGDGINDAPALMQADLGIAIGAGTNVAIESAGIILMRSDPRDIVKIIKLSRATYAKMIQNIFWATGYNVVAIPLAAGVLAYKGILMQPALSAVFMSLSTVIVAINALLLKRKKLD